MGMVRAIVAIVLIAVAASPIVNGSFGASSDVPSVYAADWSPFATRDKNDRDRETKEKNRDDEDDEDEKGHRKPTEEERREAKDEQEKEDDSARVTTNTLGLDNYQLEGNVVGLNCDIQPKEIVITTVDGEAKLFQGPRDTVNRIDRLYCGDLVVGDYVFVQEAQKRNEKEYDAFYISCQQEREEGPDNTNDNDDDVDPNCAHIWGR
jgi:hypothetical protein